ncbi:hypothetical protein DDZ14_09180 [Maritimibacter sp. 55A14]|uniref:hypothetical protein n=1 Tax=Maritimibacter sp. 55A14 TaxID=2174844 RepID=UPI000D6174CB|nr:hypothetical protein [Maritimibacter sp. 55A14]PWE32562.1 hypothetical protein DDZ14_09180 [Maritimibacter sp. 55A14]
MIVKIVTLFLVAMGVLAMFGKLRVPSVRRAAEKMKLTRVKTCPKCGNPNPGGGRCVCETRK